MPPRQKSFDEVRQQVTMELLRQKREEVQRDYIKEMMDKHEVVIHTSAVARPAGHPRRRHRSHEDWTSQDIVVLGWQRQAEGLWR